MKLFKKIAIILSVAAIAAGALAFTACRKEAEVKEGTLYQTEVISFWVGVGHAYLTLDSTEEGDKFNVNVDAGDGYSSWLSGDWVLTETTLTLTATWEDGENTTSLSNATSGVACEYTKKGGVFKIGVNIPSAGEKTFVLDPVKNATGNGGAKPEGNPSGGNEEKPKVVQLTLLSEANQAGQTAHILLYTDKSWEVGISFFEGGDFVKMAGGTFAGSMPITLTVTDDSANVLAEDTYTVTVDPSGNPVIKYDISMSLNVPQVGEVSFDFAGEYIYGA